MKTTQIIMFALVGIVSIMQFETTNAIQLTQRTAGPLEDSQNFNLIEKSRKHKRSKKDDDDDEDEDLPLPDNGANSQEMDKIDKEIKKQEKLNINPLLREIIANANKIDLQADFENKKKEEGAQKP